VRAALPDQEPYRAYALFELVLADGTISEIDLLILAPSGLFLPCRGAAQLARPRAERAGPAFAAADPGRAGAALRHYSSRRQPVAQGPAGSLAQTTCLHGGAARDRCPPPESRANGRRRARRRARRRPRFLRAAWRGPAARSRGRPRGLRGRAADGQGALDGAPQGRAHVAGGAAGGKQLRRSRGAAGHGVGSRAGRFGRYVGSARSAAFARECAQGAARQSTAGRAAAARRRSSGAPRRRRLGARRGVEPARALPARHGRRADLAARRRGGAWPRPHRAGAVARAGAAALPAG